MLFRYSFVFAFLSAAAGFIIYQVYMDKIQSQFETEREIIHLTYTSSIKSNHKISTIFYNTVINQDNVKKIVAEALDSGDYLDTRNQLREKLFATLEENYKQNKSLYNLKQLHFHFPDNTSFLRFHRPQKFGDDLTDIRLTIKQVNDSKAPVHSFEEGRIYNGYRFVFPLIYEGRHIGSVETSISMHALIDSLDEQLASQSLFLVKKELVDDKVFPSEKDNYIESPIHPQFYIERPDSIKRLNFVMRLSRAVKEKGKERFKDLKTSEEFYEYGVHRGVVYTNYFYPVVNKISGENAGYLMVHRHHSHLMTSRSVLLWIFISVVTFIGLALILHWRYRTTRKKYAESISTLEEIQKIANVGSWEYSPVSNTIWWNKQTYSIFGISENTHITKELVSLRTHPLDRNLVKEAWLAAIKSKEDFVIEYRIVMDDGSVRFLEDSCHLILNRKNKCTRVLGLTKDVTDFKEAVLQFSSVVNSQSNMLMIVRHNVLDFVNDTMLNFFNIPSKEAFDEHYGCILDTFEKEAGFFYAEQTTNRDNWLERIEKMPEFARKVAIKDKNDITRIFMVDVLEYEAHEYIVSFNDITYIQLENKLLQNEANHDKLTGALNRNFLEKYYPTLNKNLHPTKHIYFVIFDIDHFKRINDDFGHLIGDEVLVELVELVEKITRNSDKLVRWGGEEFIIILETESNENALRSIENLRQQIESHRFNSINQLTCSFGITDYTSKDSLEETLERADQALYQSKELGRNIIHTRFIKGSQNQGEKE